MSENLIKADFFNRSTLSVAKGLIGKYLLTKRGGHLCGGMIIETEAYLGSEDEASHAYCGRTKRNSLMFGSPGIIYVYLIYGMYYCFNITCEKKGSPGAVLIRALLPKEGIGEMKKRRNKNRLNALASGPAKLSQSLKIDISDNGTNILSKSLYIIDKKIEKVKIECGPRIGISKASQLNYRFYKVDDEDRYSNFAQTTRHP